MQIQLDGGLNASYTFYMSQPPQDKNKAATTAPTENQPAKELPPFIQKLKKFAGLAVSLIQKIKNSQKLKSLLGSIQKLGVRGWLKVAASALLVVASFAAYKYIPHLKNIWKFPYLSSFAPVGEKILTADSDTELVKYTNDLLAPQHIVQLNKIVVNLLPSPRSTQNPMMAFDLYLRADSEEATVEIKNREKQFQDHLQRFSESLSYDQILTEEGKQTWKLKMRKELNSILNNGRIRDIYFKNLIIKP